MIRLMLFVPVAVLICSCAGVKKSGHRALTEDMSRIEAVRIMYSQEGEAERGLDRSQFPAFTSALEGAEYDTKLNDSGIMLKMVPADYTFFITYDRSTGREEEPLSYWKGGRIKFRGLWFTLSARGAATLENLAAG